MSTTTPTPEEIKAEYASSLADLTFNSRPLINVLTMLAEENSTNAKVIVEAIETHLQKVSTDVKLPILYLIDCIVKNVGGTYTQLFSQNIVSTFCNVFKAVDEKTRAEMFKLRQTWNDVFPQMKLYAIDVQISLLDPAWPVTAKPPSNSIHFNPKFLKSNPPQGKMKEETPPTVSANPPSTIDKETLLMQEKLIQKQKELLELQQKKLELEVLQTKVKLQEQIKSGVLPVRPQNILLKPEVAKQLVPGLSKHKPAGIGAATMLQHQRPPPAIPAIPNSNGSRIHPASSALIAAAAARPIRDPRLLRQQQQQQQIQQRVSAQVQPEQATSQKPLIGSGNRAPSDKHRNRKSRRDPRIASKEEKKEVKEDQTITNREQRSPKLPSGPKPASPVPKTSSPKRDSPVPKSTESLTTGSTSSLDSPTKSKKEEKKTSQPSSPSGRRKKDRSQKERSTRMPMVPEPPTISGEDATKPTATFHSTKGSIKNRNYMKNYLRMRGHLDKLETQQSPTRPAPQDEDLRFAPPEKQPRLQLPPSTVQPPAQTPSQPSPLQPSPQQKENEKVIPAVSAAPQVPSAPKGGMDVDLRQLPTGTTKKRTSTENLEQPSTKRSKSETLDKLFGDEDTDLRQLPVVDRPQTPPPPIISSSAVDSPKEKPESPSKSNLDAIRAKLANATNRDKVLSKSYHKKKTNLEDLDLRVPKDIPPKIIITPEDEHIIKSGIMTKEQEAQLLSKIIVQMEKNKLKEARKKDHEQSFNVSLQPISDEEFLGSDEEEKSSGGGFELPQINADLPKEGVVMPFNDKDERIGMGHFVPMHNEYQPQQFYPRDAQGGFPRRFPAPWRGRGRGRHWDNQPTQHGPRGGPRQWGTWRNLGPQSQSRDFVPMQHSIPVEEEMPGSPEMPSGDQLTNGAVNQDEIKTLFIDGSPKDIRFYDETAVVFINWDDPREITFQEEGVRHVTFNDKETYALGFDQPYVEVKVNGNPHLVRIGAPSRELFIDHVPYECYFGAGICIKLDGVSTTVKLDGPPPQVKIGEKRRTDLVAGKISMFVDAVIMVPVFLDAKLQRFSIHGETSTLRFVNALETVLINDTPFNVEYGGLPKPIMIHGKKRFIRFSVLPRGVKAGKVRLKDMEGGGSASPEQPEEEDGQDVARGVSTAYDPAQQGVATGRESPERNSSSPGLFHNFLHQQSLSNLDALTNAIAPSFGPSPSSQGYQVENQQQGAPAGGVKPAQSPAKPANAPLVNINELFQKLVASGFVTSSVAAAAATAAATPQPITATSIGIIKDSSAGSDSTVIPVSGASGTVPQLPDPHDRRHNQQQQAPSSKKKTICDTLRPISLSKPETLRVRQAALYTALYSGMQCSSCGVRFSPEATMLYSQHLDWHFRQNRRGKKNARVASSRKWYYALADWKNYEELEDLEEREKNYFDQQQQAEGAAEEADEEVEIPSVPADPESTDECCEVCRDKFDQFFNEEKEEWHLRNAIRVDNKTYHPVCYEDYLQSRNDQSTLDESTKTEPPPAEEDTDNIPGLEIVNLDDDDDEEEVASSKPEVVSLESDESKNATVEAEESQPSPEPEEDDGDDDDVILNEVAPIKIVVDDDDDDDYVPANGSSQGVIRIKEEQIDDGFVEVSGLVSLQNGGQIKIKAEPIDLDDIQDVPDTSATSETVELEESSKLPPAHPELVPSIDGNVEIVSMSSNAGSTLSGKIKINISKPLPQPQDSKDEVLTENSFPTETTYVDPFEPFPPGEEPEPVSVKPALKSVKLNKLPPVRRGEELTGLCSIM
ncbi:unnamed protein product [Acanthoscelides obtectus]|uniref:Pre-mRNA cleavage complex 2 protein Pcf11 n=1 Tax=Acanthoscelides obtectus TaxID=200917 RepID=A0A9P0KGY2_ACAOB|nr:unnamed protein product [Acanthoscelides obtectus]CAK1620619.1 Pre-mRNA cleavage complex 2 protein Pcf11 [Acanthoscelides obtectus]